MRYGRSEGAAVGGPRAGGIGDGAWLAWESRPGDGLEPRHRPRRRAAVAAEGCDLLLTGRDAAALDEVAKSIRDKGRRPPSPCSTCATQIAETLVAAVKNSGGLDILVNNAGTTKRGDFFTLTPTGRRATR